MRTPQGRRSPRRRGQANSDAERRALAKASSRRTGPAAPAPRPGFAVLETDGGSRGNPGPAAIGYVLTAADGAELAAHGEAIGVAGANVAEHIGTVVFTWIPADANGAAHALVADALTLH